MKRIATTICAVIVTALGAQTLLAQGFPASEQHAVLKQEVGTWQAACKMWMPGVDDPMEFEGTEVNEMIGDLWVVSDFRGDFQGVPFRGHGRMGFNPETEKYEATWFDSMTPFVTSMSGVYDPKTKMLTSMSEGRDEAGNPKKGKSTLHYKDENTRVLVMYAAGPDGGDQWVKEMEVVYTRKD